MKSNTIKQLTDVQHVLLRPGQYIGSTTLTKVSTFVLNDNLSAFEYKEIEYVPGLLKIVYEVLDNSVDEAIRTGFVKANQIQVSIDEDTSRITISDNGRGIPLDTMEGDENMSMLEGALTCLRAGSNFDDDAGRTLLGMNGVGASLTNIFSTEFTAQVSDGTRIGKLICTNNISQKRCKITEHTSPKTGTTISFIPELSRFGLTKIDKVHLDLIHQRILFLAITYPEIQFKFNKKTVNSKSIKNFVNMFSKSAVTVTDDHSPCKYIISVLPNTSDEFNHKSYINGADCLLGGNHLDVISNELLTRLRTKLIKKYPSIKIGDIKNHISYVVNFREFVNPAFNSQTKENFSSSAVSIKKFIDDINWDEVVAKIIKTPEIIEPIVESFKIREELKKRQTLDKINRSSYSFTSKNFIPSITDNKYFAIVEGLSAMGGLVESIGRKGIAYYATRGVPLNTYETSVDRIAENKELTEIIKCLHLKLGSAHQDMAFQNILLANDADSDGTHIAGLYITFFSKYCRSIIENGQLKRLKTPVICLSNKRTGKIEQFFFNLTDYSSFVKAKPNHGLSEKYYKGLGSWEKNDLKFLIDKFGLDNFIETVTADDISYSLIDDWYNKDKVNIRKEYIKQNEFSLFSI